MEVINNRDNNMLTIYYIEVHRIDNDITFKLEMIYEIPTKQTCLLSVVLD